MTAAKSLMLKPMLFCVPVINPAILNLYVMTHDAGHGSNLVGHGKSTRRTVQTFCVRNCAAETLTR